MEQGVKKAQASGRGNVFGIFSAAVFLFASFALSGCSTTGNGVMREVRYADTPAQRICIEGKWTVKVFCNAPENRVTVAAEDNLWKDIDISRSRGEICVRASGGEMRPTLPMTVTIQTTSAIGQIDLSNSVNATVDGLRHRCDISLTNASSLDVKDCALQNGTISLTGNSRMTLSGAIRTLDFRGIGNSHLDADDCGVGIFNGYADTNSHIRLGSAGTVTATINNTSSLYIADLAEKLEGSADNASEVLVGGEGNTGNFKLERAATLIRLDK
ncbi:hypothetical protein SDC9_155600 [bioreactor metagenome]|uniref:Putative auto-transporter adhesin head GIN domain-containing protein n=1 Tax=bioreactor metagenome TaxID=1076179 RepID=A0A645F1X4_9ZZZZ|nr:DUF2807 domain-containing protein [Victivallaceae bacterium]